VTRILYFARDYTTHDFRFLSSLAKTGYDVYYLRLERRGQDLEERPLPSEINQVPWVGGNAPARWQAGMRLLADLKRVIRMIKPDLIQAGPIQTCGFLVALTGFRPLVSMSWGYDLLIDANRNALWQWVTHFTLQHSAALVGDCATIRSKAIEFGMNDEHVITFPWGVDIDHYNIPITPGPDHRPFTLLSTRGWEPIYGVDVLASAFIQVTRAQPEIQLTMLGYGSQAEALKNMFRDGGVLDRVTFPGHVNQMQLPGYYQSADLYISASHSDGTSISLLEAMACGCPVLVSDIPGNCEWVTPGENGWLFPDGNPEALAQAILTAFEHRKNLPEMGRNARQLVEKRADWDINFPKLFDAYKLVLR
jgi:L-malate glycosyltransferase